MSRKAIRISMAALVLLILFGTVGLAATRTVNQTSGPYTTIASALSAAASGDTVLITDSLNYYESIQIPANKSNITIQGLDGEMPVIVAPASTPNNYVLSVLGSGCTLKNVTVYNDGLTYGVSATGTNLTITGCTFDMHITPRIPGGSTFGIYVNGITSTITESNFYGTDTVACGGILANGTVNLTTQYCDFWYCGRSGGMVGLGVTANSTVSVRVCTFGNTRTGQYQYAINAWGVPSLAITESDNTFFDIDTPISSIVNGGVLNAASSWSGTGTCTPSNSSTVFTMGHMDNLLICQGVTVQSDAVLQSYTGPSGTTVGYWLARNGRMNYYADFRNFWDSVLGESIGTQMRHWMSTTNARMFDGFEISWARNYTPAYWKTLKDYTAEVRGSCPDLMIHGYIMEAVGKTNLENTPIPNWLWCWNSRWAHATSIRPLEVKVINGRRICAHFFDYDVMLGYGVNAWGTDVSVPNINKQEGMLYYLYQIMQMTKAGINCVLFAEPHITFGQALNDYVTGGVPLQMCTKFAKNYGLGYASVLKGKSFTMVGVAASIYWLKNYCQYADYVDLPVYGDAYGMGRSWTTLSDSYNTIPPASATIAGKPTILAMDNCGVGDAISTYAIATPAVRNSWWPAFKSYVWTNNGYYMQAPGFIPITPVGCQNFTGALYNPPVKDQYNNWTFPFAWYFLPWDEYAGNEATTRNNW